MNNLCLRPYIAVICADGSLKSNNQPTTWMPTDEARLLWDSVLTWVRGFLSHWTQRVLLDGQASDYTHVLYVSPGNWAWPPILFLCFISDLLDAATSSICLFADDAVVYRKIHSIEDSRQFREILIAWSSWGTPGRWSYIQRNVCFSMSPGLLNLRYSPITLSDAV